MGENYAEHLDEKLHYLIVYTVPLGLSMILKEGVDGYTNQLYITGWKLAVYFQKITILSSAACGCNSCYILQGPGVKHADLS